MPAFIDAVAKQWPEPGNPFTPDVLVSFILDAEPLFPAGESWAYTDTGYILIGLVIIASSARNQWGNLIECGCYVFNLQL